MASGRGYGAGKARGKRGTNRGRGFAQSGGVSHTFQGGKGGPGASSGFGQAGGSRGQGVLGTQINAAGNTVRVRKPGGDATTLKGGLHKPKPTTFSTKGKRGASAFDHVAPTVRKGAGRQAGGSTQ